MPASFGNKQSHVGSFRAEDLTLTLGGQKAVLVQQVQFTCNRTVNMLYEIGSNNVYYVGNRRQGQCQMSRVVGGNASMRQLITKFGNMCSPDTLELKATGSGGGKCSQAKRTYTMLDATLTSIGASITAQEIVLTENLGFIFSDLEDT
jgi:hypothetical protein